MKPSLLLQFCFNSCRKRNRKSDLDGRFQHRGPRFELSIINEVPSCMESYNRRASCAASNYGPSNVHLEPKANHQLLYQQSQSQHQAMASSGKEPPGVMKKQLSTDITKS